MGGEAFEYSDLFKDFDNAFDAFLSKILDLQKSNTLVIKKTAYGLLRKAIKDFIKDEREAMAERAITVPETLEQSRKRQNIEAIKAVLSEFKYLKNGVIMALSEKEINRLVGQIIKRTFKERERSQYLSGGDSEAHNDTFQLVIEFLIKKLAKNPPKEIRENPAGFVSTAIDNFLKDRARRLGRQKRTTLDGKRPIILSIDDPIKVADKNIAPDNIKELADKKPIPDKRLEDEEAVSQIKGLLFGKVKKNSQEEKLFKVLTGKKTKEEFLKETDSKSNHFNYLITKLRKKNPELKPKQYSDYLKK